MNYGKKDEDADTGLVRVDRTQVFQEGERLLAVQLRGPLPLAMLASLTMLTRRPQRVCSTARPYKPGNVASS